MQGLLKAIATGVASLLMTAGLVGAEPLGIGTLPQGSLGYSIASSLAKVVTENSELEVRAVGQGGSTVYIPQVNSGELAFGTSNTFESIFARNGTGNFEGRVNENLRLVTTLVPFTVGFMVRNESEFNSVTDLKGQPFPTGYSSMKLVAIMQEAIFEAVGMSEGDLKPVPVPNFVKGAELLAQGRVAGVLLAPGSGVVAKTDAQAPIRFLDIPNDDQTIARIRERLPSTYLAEVKPRPNLPGIVKPTTLLGYKYTLVANKDVPDEVVYAVVKALHENKPGLAASHGIFNRFDPADMAVAIEGIEYHPGAVKFFKEAGIWQAGG